MRHTTSTILAIEGNSQVVRKSAIKGVRELGLCRLRNTRASYHRRHSLLGEGMPALYPLPSDAADKRSSETKDGEILA